MIRFINLCNYSFELDLDCEKHGSIYMYTSEKRQPESVLIKCFIVEYSDLMKLIKSRCYVPDLSVFSGGGEKYYLNVAKDLGIIVYSLIEENITYISELNGKIRESSGYMLFTLLKNHLNRYIFANNQIPIHAALLQSDNMQNTGSIIVLGESGAGKSTLCYRIHQELGYEVYSDDLIVFDPNSKDVYGYCQFFFLKEDMVHKYGLEEICQKRNGKYALSAAKDKAKGARQVSIIYLKENSELQMITPGDLYYCVMDCAKFWCKTSKEEKTYQKVTDLFESAQQIISGSYLCTDHILEVLKK